MKHSVSIYNYSNPRQFLLDSLAAAQKGNPSHSVRAWAKQMGLTSHALLVMLLQGKRPLRVHHAIFLSKGLSLSPPERLYLQALIQFDNAITIEEKTLCRVWLADLNPGKTFHAQEVEAFLAISHWVHMAILAMTELKGSGLTEERAIEILGKRSSQSEVRAAVDRLKSLGLLVVMTDGTLKAGCDAVSTKDDTANTGARKYHKNVMELATAAIEAVPLERREFQACALAVPHSHLPLAKEMIRKFRAQFVAAMRTEPGDDVYQLNIQFFQLTESPKVAAHPRVTSEDEGVEHPPTRGSADPAVAHTLSPKNEKDLIC